VAQLHDEARAAVLQGRGMTVLRCPCGALLEGDGTELLSVVEQHVAVMHGPDPRPSDAGGRTREATADPAARRPGNGRPARKGARP
jgi:hypothetical protein